MHEALKRMLIGSLAVLAATGGLMGLMWTVGAAFGFESSLLHGLSTLPVFELILGGAVAGLVSTRFHWRPLKQLVQRQESAVYRMLLGSLQGFLVGFVYGAIVGSIAGAAYILGQATHPQSTVESSAELIRYIFLMSIAGAWVGGWIGGIANSVWQALRELRIKPKFQSA